MPTMRHPRFPAITREVEMSDVGRWERAGWVNASPKPRRARRRKPAPAPQPDESPTPDPSVDAE